MIDGISLTVFLLSAAVAFAGIFLLKRNGKQDKNLKYPPSLPWLPFIGSLPFVNGGMDVLPQFFMKTAERLGPVFSFYAEKELVIVLNGKKAIFDSLFKQSEIFADRQYQWTEIYRHNKELRGIIWARYNDTFRKYHKLVLSIFREFGFGVNHESDVRVWNVLEDFFVKLRTYNNQVFNPKDELIQATARVFMNILFGCGLEAQNKYTRKLTLNANGFIAHLDPAINLAPLMRFLPTFSKKISIMDHHSKELLEGLEDAIAHYKSDPSADNCLVKRFLEIQGPQYNHKDFVYVIRDLCIGSSDTMAITTTWVLIEMANRPEIKIRVQKEIDENIAHDRFPAYDDRRVLPYTEATLMESMRHHILAPFAVPHAALRDTQLGEFFIPKGSAIIPNLHSIHMEKELWKDPENFRPERFLDENMKIVGRENLVSFSIGKRACIGETLARHEVFVFFSSLMQHFDPLPPPGKDRVPHDLESGITISPRNTQMRLVPRKRL